MKTLISLGSIVLFGLVAMGQVQPAGIVPPPATPGKGPHITFSTNSFDFGTVDAGAVVKYEFGYTNTGTETLEISSVRASCGCTTASTWDRQLPPGKTGLIPIQFNSTGFGGSVAKTVTVTCNDPANSNVVLTLKGNVFKPIQAMPSMAMFSVAPDAAGPQVQTVQIRNSLPEPITLSQPICTNEYFQVELKTLSEGKAWELAVTMVKMVPRPLSTTVTIPTSSPRAPAVSITAYANLLPMIGISPTQIIVPAGPLTAAMSVPVTFRNNGTNSVVFSSPEFGAKEVTVGLKEVQPGKVYIANLDFPAGFITKEGEKYELTIKTTGSSNSVIKVPFFQMPPTVKTAGVSTAVRRPDGTTSPATAVQ